MGLIGFYYGCLFAVDCTVASSISQQRGKSLKYCESSSILHCFSKVASETVTMRTKCSEMYLSLFYSDLDVVLMLGFRLM